LVPEISRLWLRVKKGMWPTMVSEVIFRLRILRRIQWCYFCDSLSSGSGDNADRIKSQKGVWPKNFDDVIFWVKILRWIQWWLFRHQAPFGSGDIEVRVKGKKSGVVKKFR
jgi:hypothetical protein